MATSSEASTNSGVPSWGVGLGRYFGPGVFRFGSHISESMMINVKTTAGWRVCD